MIKWLFRISVSIGLAGMLGGMAMGMTQNFVLAPAHAHFILLGYIVMFLSALYYRTVPEAAASQLALLLRVEAGDGAVERAAQGLLQARPLRPCDYAEARARARDSLP